MAMAVMDIMVDLAACMGVACMEEACMAVDMAMEDMA